MLASGGLTALSLHWVFSCVVLGFGFGLIVLAVVLWFRGFRFCGIFVDFVEIWALSVVFWVFFWVGFGLREFFRVSFVLRLGWAYRFGF